MSHNAAKRDTISGTLIVAFVLCVVCSVIVASAAVLLKPKQDANKKLDQQRNVLVAAGVDVDSMSTDQIIEIQNQMNQKIPNHCSLK